MIDVSRLGYIDDCMGDIETIKIKEKIFMIRNFSVTVGEKGLGD